METPINSLLSVMDGLAPANAVAIAKIAEAVHNWKMVTYPPLYTQVQADWSASSGIAVILNKPSIPAGQIQSDWNANSGLAVILNKPNIPAAQVNSDWNAGSGIVAILNKPTIPAAQVQVDWNSGSGLNSILNKPTIPATQVQSDWSAVSGLGVVLNKPTIQVIQRIRAQTDTSGNYTWVFGTAYGAGVVPIISIAVEDSGSSIWNTELTSVTNTQVVVKLTKTSAVTVLGVSVLGVQSNPQAYLHLTAVAP